MGMATMEEKSIMELYEQYLTDEMIEESKKEKNDLEEDNKKSGMKLIKHNQEERFDTDNKISIAKYINNYLGLPVFDCSKITHSELKRLNCPYVVTVANDFAKQNPERVEKGELLVVEDTRGNLGTYFNPDSIKQFLLSGDIHSTLSTFVKKGIHDTSKLQEYWENCQKMVVVQEQNAINNSFLELLIKANKVGKIDQIKNYLDACNQIRPGLNVENINLVESLLFYMMCHGRYIDKFDESFTGIKDIKYNKIYQVIEYYYTKNDNQINLTDFLAYVRENRRIQDKEEEERLEDEVPDECFDSFNPRDYECIANITINSVSYFLTEDNYDELLNNAKTINEEKKIFIEKEDKKIKSIKKEEIK